MHPLLHHRWHKLSSQIHRLRVLLHAQGLSALLARLGQQDNAGPFAEPFPRPSAQADRQAGGPRILIIDSSTPRPDRDSGSLRASNLMQVLRELGYGIDFLPEDGIDAGAYTVALHAMGVNTLLAQEASPPIRWLMREHQRYQAVIIARYHLASYWIPSLRHIAPDMKIVLDTVDLHYLREKREAELHGNQGLLRASKATRKRELHAIRSADVTWVVSPAEKEMLSADIPGSNVEVVPNLHQAKAEVPGYAERTGMIFVGGGRHPPNVDAVNWLLADIFPRIRKRLPGCVLHLVGEGLESRVQPRKHEHDGVIFHGFVPELDGLLGSTRLGLAPLRFGAGVKGKVNQYMAHGLPTIATSCAAEGMHLLDGEDVMIASDADHFTDAAVTLYEDPDAWHTLSCNGLSNIEKYFSFESARKALFATFNDIRRNSQA